MQANETPIHAPKNPQAIAKLPADFHFVKPGQFTVAIAALNTPPLALFAADNRRLIGSEVDIAQLVADSPGLTLNVVQTSWEDWPLGWFPASMTRHHQRHRDQRAQNPLRLRYLPHRLARLLCQNRRQDRDDQTACRYRRIKIIVGSGTNQEAILLAWDKQNRQQGLKPFQPIYVTDDAAATLAIQSGRADAYFGPNVLGAYKAALNGRTRLAGTVEGGWPKAAHIAVTTRKGNGPVQAVNEALNGAIRGGQYDRVLNRWGESVERLAQSEINPPGRAIRSAR